MGMAMVLLSREANVTSDTGNKIVSGMGAEAAGCPRGDVGEVAGIGVVAVNGRQFCHGVEGKVAGQVHDSG